MSWKPSTPGEVPTLGYEIIDWIAEELNSPNNPNHEPMVLTREQEDFILKWYAIDPKTGRFVKQRGLICRPRGWGKSPLLGALCLAEGLGPVLFDGWDANGQPVGRPWSWHRIPKVQVAAVSEAQAENTWGALLSMVDEAPVLDDYPGCEPMGSFMNLPVGRIEKVTASARSLRGAPSCFAVLDQTESWVPSNGGPLLAQTMRTNCGKGGGRTVEAPNAFVPGDNSVAEESAKYANLIETGQALIDDLLYDHREAPADTDVTDKKSLLKGLRFAYGDSSDDEHGCTIHTPPCKPGWAPVANFVNNFFDPANDVQLLRADYLNQITYASDSWVSKQDWLAREDLTKTIASDEPVVLGFDGSRGRVRGRADATALIGCRVRDGHIFTVHVWEAPYGSAGKDWSAPTEEVTAEVRDSFKRWNVIGLYADPSGWQTQIAEWQAEFNNRLRVRASLRDPMAVWPRSKDTRAVEAVEDLRRAVVTAEMTQDGSAVLMRHVLNARRRQARNGYLLYKKYPESPDKIDAAYAAVMAWKARTDALKLGYGKNINTQQEYAFFT